MRLLFLTQSLDLDDPILGFAHGWIAALARHVDHVIAAPLRAGRVELPANVEVRSLGKEHADTTMQKLKGFARVVGGACRRGEVDAILAHMVPRYAVYAAPFALPRRIPIFLWYTHKGVDWSLRLAEPVIRRAFTASERSFRLESAKKVVTGHGIDTAQFRPPDASDPAPTHDIAVVGRIAPAKDPLVLVEALGLLKARGLTPRVVLAGGTLLDAHDAYQRQVEARVAALGIADQLTFLGPVPHHEVRRVFLDAPIFVTPSRTGSVDKTVLEAMACGRLAVTCNESFEEVLGSLAPRLLFPVGDAESLAVRLEQLLALGDAERDDVARRLRELVCRDHDLERLAARLAKEMREFVQGGRPSVRS